MKMRELKTREPRESQNHLQHIWVLLGATLAACGGGGAPVVSTANSEFFDGSDDELTPSTVGTESEDAVPPRHDDTSIEPRELAVTSQSPPVEEAVRQEVASPFCRAVTPACSGALEDGIRYGLATELADIGNFGTAHEVAMVQNGEIVVTLNEGEERVFYIFTRANAGSFSGDVTISGADADDVALIVAKNQRAIAIEFSSALDFEAPQDQNLDNVYQFSLAVEGYQSPAEFKVRVRNSRDESDDVGIDGNSNKNSLATTLADVGRFDWAEKMARGEDGEILLTVNEGQERIFYFFTRDNAHNVRRDVTLSGEDAEDVELIVAKNKRTIGIQFVSKADFEAPQDHNGDNVYRFALALDGYDDPAEFEVTVLDVA